MNARKRWWISSSGAVVVLAVYILVSVWIMHDVKDTLRMAYMHEASGK
ncbi:SPW repeat protein [Paenibacillus sp. HB172176]|nr:SPW repeat protein [Paenibacillus sp. HB172176]